MRGNQLKPSNKIITARKGFPVVALSLLLWACQMPTYNSTNLPSGSSGPSGPSGPSVPSGSGGGLDKSTGGQPSIPTGGGEPAGQSIDDLDQTLDQSLEGFDDSMGNNKQTAGDIDILSPTGNSDLQPDATTPTNETGGITRNDSVVEENDSLAERASEGADTQVSESADPSSNSTSDKMTSSQQGETAQSIPIPEDIGDGQGDNIVLRQIREAAMKERDPALRDRLWDEYRKIKNQ